MKHTVVVALFCVYNLLCSVVIAEEFLDGVDLFVEAVRYRCENHTLVRSLSYRTSQTYRMPTLTEEEIEKAVTEEEASVRRDFETRGLQPPFWIDEVRDTVRKHYEQTSILSRFTVKYKAPSLSRKLLSLQIERQRQGEDGSAKWVTDIEVIEANVVSNKSESEGAVWYPQQRSAHVNETQPYTETLLNFGRLQGTPVMFMHALLFQDTDIEKYEFSGKNIAKFKEERDKLSRIGQGKVLQTVGTVSYDNGEGKAYLVESSTDGRVIERYWIDVARGYICPLIQYYDEKGKLLSEYKSENYFLHEKSGQWFPQLFREMTINRDGKQEFKEYRIDKSSLDVNFPIEDEEFVIEIPDGARVIDDRKGKGSQRYMAVGNGVLSLGKGGLDLEKMNWLAPAEVSEVPSVRFSFVQVLCLTAGILLILLGIYFRLHRKT